MDPLQQLLAERACERLILDFVHRLDLEDPGSVAELFTEDGWWEWPPPGDGRRSEGREALRKYFGARPADKLSRRIMSNVRVTVTAADTAEATSYFTTYRIEGWSGGMVPAGPPVQVGLPHSRLRSSGGTPIQDTFRRVDGQWLLATRTLHLPFGGPTPRQGRGALEPVRAAGPAQS